MFELGYDFILISCIKRRCYDKESSRWSIFLSASDPRPIYDILFTSCFYLTLPFSSEDKHAKNKD
jgi:hypothetical protein